MTSNQIHDLAISILDKTHDGDDLSGADLKFVEHAINGNLSPRGEVMFYQLNEKVRNGYEIPAFCGVEGLTRNQEGFVFWKGIQIEHYDHDFWEKEGWGKRMKEDAKDLGRGCQWLEDNGIPVNFSNWYDNKHKWRN